VSTSGVAGAEGVVAPVELEPPDVLGAELPLAAGPAAEGLEPDELPQPAASSVAAAATAVSWTARRHAGRTVTARPF